MRGLPPTLAITILIICQTFNFVQTILHDVNYTSALPSTEILKIFNVFIFERYPLRENSNSRMFLTLRVVSTAFYLSNFRRFIARNLCARTGKPEVAYARTLFGRRRIRRRKREFASTKFRGPFVRGRKTEEGRGGKFPMNRHTVLCPRYRERSDGTNETEALAKNGTERTIEETRQ